MHGLNTIIAMNRAKQEAHDAATAPRIIGPAVAYVSYEYAPACMDGPDHVTRCEPHKAEFWGVYGRYPNGEASHVCDCVDEASADSAVSLLNALRPAPATAVDPVHTFEGELHETIALYTGARQLSAVERMVLRYAEIIRKHVDADVRAELAAVFPLEVR